ncbi:MAG: ABC transporter substrate-binding protein, partial [Aeromonas allosaccharophila]
MTVSRNSLRHYASPSAAALLTLLLGTASHTALAAAQPVPAELKLAIGSEPTEGFDPLLGWSHGSYLLLHSPLLKQNA